MDSFPFYTDSVRAYSLLYLISGLYEQLWLIFKDTETDLTTVFVFWPVT